MEDKKRVLERIGHVMRMENGRVTKAVVLGWYEGRSKMAEEKRKTILYWKKILKEAGIDETNIERLTADRNKWKSLVAERMSQLDKWERQRGHRYEWKEREERMSRNVRRTNELKCRYEWCGKVCKSRVGLMMHEKRMHRVVEERVWFECSEYGRECDTQGARKNHERTCGGGMSGGARRECENCNEWVTKANYARHRRMCLNEERMERDGGVRGKTKDCERCSRVLSVANMARHLRGCQVWDPGGGAKPSRALNGGR